MKKYLSLLLALGMTLSLLAGCGSTSSEDAAESGDSSTTTETGDDVKRVAFLVNGSLGDSGFFDSCQEGMDRLASEYGCEVRTIEMGKDETTYETYFRDVSEQDWDLIVAATWSVQEVLQDIAVDYPDQQYLFLDGEIEGDNIMGINFRSNETGFMAGCLAALQLNAGGEKIDPAQKVVGFVGSMDTTNINDFLVGYIDGIQYVDDSIKVITSYVGSFEDVATCLEMTTQLYNQGAQIVYAPASQSIVGAVTASSDCDKYLIGCDTNVYSEMVGTDPELVRNVLSSSMKRMGDALVTAATGLWDGTMSVGENYSMGLAEGTVGLADNDNYQTLVSEEVRTQLDEISTLVGTGEVEIGSAYDMDTAAITELRNSVMP